MMGTWTYADRVPTDVGVWIPTNAYKRQPYLVEPHNVVFFPLDAPEDTPAAAIVYVPDAPTPPPGEHPGAEPGVVVAVEVASDGRIYVMWIDGYEESTISYSGWRETYSYNWSVPVLLDDPVVTYSILTAFDAPVREVSRSTRNAPSSQTFYGKQMISLEVDSVTQVDSGGNMVTIEDIQQPAAWYDDALHFNVATPDYEEAARNHNELPGVNMVYGHQTYRYYTYSAIVLERIKYTPILIPPLAAGVIGLILGGGGGGGMLPAIVNSIASIIIPIRLNGRIE